MGWIHPCSTLVQYFSTYFNNWLANLALQVPMQNFKFGIVIRNNENKLGNQVNYNYI